MKIRTSHEQLAKEAEEWDKGIRKVDKSWQDAPEALIGLKMKYRMKVKKYVDDSSLTWQERYARLESHHLDETKELIQRIEWLEEDLAREYRLRCELYDDWSNLADRALSACRKYEKKLKKLQKKKNRTSVNL